MHKVYLFLYTLLLQSPNMSIPSVGAMRTGQCSVLGSETVGIWDPGGSQESDDMKYVAII